MGNLLEDQVALEARVIALIRERSRRVDIVPVKNLLEACLLSARFSWPSLAEAFLLVAWLLEPQTKNLHQWHRLPWPPLTEALALLASFTPPPHSEAKLELATLSNPPMTQADVSRARFAEPPLTEACWPLAEFP